MRREEVIRRLAESRDALAPFHVKALFLSRVDLVTRSALKEQLRERILGEAIRAA